jgi:hypothetical protein
VALAVGAKVKSLAGKKEIAASKPPLGFYPFKYVHSD